MKQLYFIMLIASQSLPCEERSSNGGKIGSNFPVMGGKVDKIGGNGHKKGGKICVLGGNSGKKSGNFFIFGGNLRVIAGNLGKKRGNFHLLGSNGSKKKGNNSRKARQIIQSAVLGFIFVAVLSANRGFPLAIPPASVQQVLRVRVLPAFFAFDCKSARS